MLIPIENDFVDVIREQGYRDLLTVRASSAEALKRFDPLTMAVPLQVPHHIYDHILHVSEEAMRMSYPSINFRDVEKFQRLTPAPIAYVYEWAIDHGENNIEGCYSYCWADEADATWSDLHHGEEELAGEPRFYPIFFIPDELVGAPPKFSFQTDNDEQEFDDDED
jgi:hypothetical protein